MGAALGPGCAAAGLREWPPWREGSQLDGWATGVAVDGSIGGCCREVGSRIHGRGGTAGEGRATGKIREMVWDLFINDDL